MMDPDRRPTVSIIVPAYNHERFIVRCLESVRRQDWRPVELVVIDDGSSDGTWANIETWAEHGADGFTRVHVERTRNRGLAATLNHALSLATGEYVCPLASDDLLRADALTQRVAIMEQEPLLAGIFGDARVVDEHERELSDSALFGWYRGSRRRLHSHLVPELITNFSVPGPVLLVRRAALEAIGGYPPSLSVEDWYLYLRLAATGGLRFYDHVVADYRVHGGNVSRDPTRRARELEDQVQTSRMIAPYLGSFDRHLLELVCMAALGELRALDRPWLARVIGATPRAIARILTIVASYIPDSSESPNVRP